VSELSPTQLDLIAGEDILTKQLRKNLKNEITALEKGKKLLRAWGCLNRKYGDGHISQAAKALAYTIQAKEEEQLPLTYLPLLAI
jgi:hypothetical protein